MAFLNRDEKMLNLLLDHPHKIGDINYTNELKKKKKSIFTLCM